LKKKLPGYAKYCKKARFRLLPEIRKIFSTTMKNTFPRGTFHGFTACLLCAGLALGLGGCMTLGNGPAVVKMIDYQDTFTALRPSEVYFFLSKDAFPPGLQSVAVGTLWTPTTSQWTYGQLVSGFQAGAAGIGANAVVFEGVGTHPLLFGGLYYTGYATAYRLYKQSPSEDVDLSASQYGTQNPDLHKVK
jgi:hypothetical protein